MILHTPQRLVGGDEAGGAADRGHDPRPRGGHRAAAAARQAAGRAARAARAQARAAQAGARQGTTRIVD